MSISLGESNDAGQRERFEEACHALRIRLAPAVDCLVFVPHRDHAAGLRGEQGDELLLDRVGVLELVDQQLAYGAPAGSSHLRMLGQQLGSEQKKVVQVESSDLLPVIAIVLQ